MADTGPTCTASSTGGMVPTSYWLSSSRKRRINCSPSQWVSPSMSYICSSAPRRISHSWFKICAARLSPAASSSCAMRESRISKEMSSKKPYSARICPRRSEASRKPCQSRVSGAIASSRTVFSSSNRCWSSSVHTPLRPSGWFSQLCVHFCPRMPQMMA